MTRPRPKSAAPLPVAPVTIGELIETFRAELAPSDDVLVMVHNRDGQPCGWGIAATVNAATDEAERQWLAYVRRYEGEHRAVRGKVTTAHLPSKGGRP